MSISTDKSRLYTETVDGVEHGISLAEIASCVGGSRLDTGYLCTHNNIRMWAKYKPIRHTTLGKLTDAQRVAANYGLGNIPTYNYIATMLSDMKAGVMTNASNKSSFDVVESTPWAYLRPKGGVSGTSASPYRILDFDGYDNGADAPASVATDSSFQRQSSGLLVITWRGAASDADAYLQFRDLKVGSVNLRDLYVGLCVYSSSTQYYVTQMVTADDTSTALKVSDIPSYGIFFRTTKIPNGSYNAFLFFSSVVLNGVTSYSSSGTFIPVNFTECEFSVSQAVRNVTISGSAWRTTITGAISGSYVISNADNTGYGISAVKVEFLDSAGNLLYTGTQGSATTLTAKGTITSGTLTIATASVVSANNLRSATNVRYSITIGGTTYQGATSITLGPPKI